MSITPEFLDELRHRLPVSQVVGRHVQLKRQGREYAGLSPFNKEKTPSFTVNDQKQFYHCFSSGKHGDIISFVMEVEGLSFPEAVEALAAQAGLDVPKPTPQQAAKAERAKTLHDVCEAACLYFEKALYGSEGQGALDYIESRGLDRGTLERFRLGYAPSDRQAMRKALKKLGFDDAMMIEAGLVKPSQHDGREPFSFFSHRLLFPVTDRRSRVVAFGGRLLDGEGPKYLNSPDTPLFHKSQLLYNMAGARQHAGKGHTIIVVEGYMDVIAMVRAGFEGAVAPLGTALTEDQVVEAWRLAGPGGPAPILCFDGDAAGQRAAFRAVQRILPQVQPDRTVRFTTMPDGEDPDSLLQQGGKAGLLACLEQTDSLADKLWQMEVSQRSLDTPEAWAGLQAGLDKQIGTIEHQELRRFYGQEFQSRVRDAAYQHRRAQREQQRGSRPGQRSGTRSGSYQPSLAVKPKSPQSPTPFAHRVILKTLMAHPSLLDEHADMLCELPIADQALATLRDALISLWSEDQDCTPESLLQSLNERGLQAAIGRLQSGQGIEFLSFAKPSAEPRDARRGIADALDTLHRHALTDELSDTAKRLDTGDGSAPSEDDMGRWRSLNHAVLDARFTHSDAD
ncbi:MAG: DNA primase [Pseudomonadota bacterium]